MPWGAVGLSAAAVLAVGSAPLRAQVTEAPSDPALQTPAVERQDDTLAPVPQAPVEAAIPHRAAVLQGLDKTTARVSTFAAPIGLPARFGTLEITARACAKKPPTEPPESAAFLEIVDVRPDSPAVQVFSGWMFASSPAISALEHPVYDVWVVDCRQAGEAAETAAASESAPTEAAPTESAPAAEATPPQAGESTGTAPGTAPGTQ